MKHILKSDWKTTVSLSPEGTSLWIVYKECTESKYSVEELAAKSKENYGQSLNEPVLPPSVWNSDQTGYCNKNKSRNCRIYSKQYVITVLITKG